MANKKLKSKDQAQGRQVPERPALSRRSFLKSSGLAAAGVSSSVWMSPSAFAAGSGRSDVLVHVFLNGGMDGLTACVPYGDPELYIARPNLAVPPAGAVNGALDLDGFFGLSPALTGLMTPYSSGDLAIVHAAGSTDPTRSHFEAMIAMERGAPEQEYNLVSSGWLARHMNALGTGGAPRLRSLALTDITPIHLVGMEGALPVSDPQTMSFPGGAQSASARERTIRRMYAGSVSPLDSAMETSFETLDLFESVGFAGYVPSGGAIYPSTPLGDQLRQSAALIKNGAGIESISIDYDGWDHHNAMGPHDGVLVEMLTNLGNSLEAFYLDLGTWMDSVTVVVISEFGRRVAENGSLGTDHGHGGCMFVMGGHVNGGQVYSSWPGLSPAVLDSGDLAVTADYRDVLWEILEKRMGATDVGAVFPNHVPTTLGIL